MATRGLDHLLPTCMSLWLQPDKRTCAFLLKQFGSRLANTNAFIYACRVSHNSFLILGGECSHIVSLLCQGFCFCGFSLTLGVYLATFCLATIDLVSGNSNCIVFWVGGSSIPLMYIYSFYTGNAQPDEESDY